MASQQHYTQHSATSVLASEDVSSGFVVAQLQFVDSIAAVTELSVEGFVRCEAHRSRIFPMLQSILFSGTRNWKTVQFTDSILHTNLGQWIAAKNKMMREIEMNSAFLPNDWCNGKLCWKAAMTIPEDQLQEIMTEIDKDPDIFDVSIEHIKGTVVLEIASGWSRRTDRMEELLSQYSRISSRQLGDKQRMSDRSDSSLNCSISSFSSLSLQSTSDKGPQRRRRKRVRRMLHPTKNETPDYNWEAGVYVGAVVGKQ